MTDDPVTDGDDPGGELPVDPDAPQSQQVQHAQFSARVPEHVARGRFSTGAVVLNGPHEFIIDFLLRMTHPHQVAARVVLPPPVVPRMIKAVSDNLANYEQRFGPPPPVPQAVDKPDPPKQPSAQELYEELRLSDEEVSGTYANAVMVGHTATEFSFDFITTFFPRSAVSARIYLAAPNVPRFLDSLTHSWEQYQKKAGQPPVEETDGEPVD